MMTYKTKAGILKKQFWTALQKVTQTLDFGLVLYKQIRSVLEENPAAMRQTRQVTCLKENRSITDDKCRL
jgi:hypothetical protein